MAAIPPSASRNGPPLNVPTIRLGSVLFYPEELPNRFPATIEQRTPKMEMLGGGSFSQPLGVQHPDIAWSGKIRSNYPHEGQSAADRAQTLERMIAIGKRTKLSWLKRARYVIPQRFEAVDIHENRTDYTITLQVVRDISGTATIATVPSADSQLAELMDRSSTQAAALRAGDPGATSLSAQVSSTSSTVSQAGPITSLAGTSSGKNLLTTVQGTLTSARSYLAALASTMPRSHILSAQGLVTSLSLAVSQIKSGQSARSAIADHGTIDDVALREYGNISYARALQAANGLAQPEFETGIVTSLIIPAFTNMP